MSNIFKMGDKVTIHDRGMKVNGFNGEIVGIETNTDQPVYNVLLELKDRNDKPLKKTKMYSFLESQLVRRGDAV